MRRWTTTAASAELATAGLEEGPGRSEGPDSEARATHATHGSQDWAGRAALAQGPWAPPSSRAWPACWGSKGRKATLATSEARGSAESTLATSGPLPAGTRRPATAPPPRLRRSSFAAKPDSPGRTRSSEPATLVIDGTGLTLEIGSGRPIRAGFRDVSLIAIQQSTVLLVLGEGADSMRFLLERFGDKLGPMVRLLRELRLKQRLTDGLVEVPDAPAELMEFAWQPTGSPLGPGPDGPSALASGVGQFVVQPWGFVVCPLDERLPWIHYRRASISTVKVPQPGEVIVDGTPGTLTLRGLGSASTRLRDRLQKLRDGAFADASGFVEQLMPDAPFGVRQKAADSLVDGRPVRPEVFGDAGWPIIETAVLGEPTFAESYQSLCATGGPAAPRWVAMSPEQPGGTTPKIWFLVAMPGNLVALELVTAGAHATYFYRVMPRAQYRGEPPEKLGIAAEQAVRDISEALVDCRFLREPMALPDEQLRLPKYLRYRLALAVLPSLAWARGRFVARVVHKDPASWSGAVADLIRWHSTATDEAAVWPGRAAQEKAVLVAGGEAPDDGDTEFRGRSRVRRPTRQSARTPRPAGGLHPDSASDTSSKPSGSLG